MPTCHGWVSSQEVERLAIDFVKNVVFGSQHDSHLRNALKGATKPEDLLANEPFKPLLDQIHTEITKLVKAEDAQEASEEENEPLLHDILGEMIDESDESAADLLRYAKQAEEIVDPICQDHR